MSYVSTRQVSAFGESTLALVNVDDISLWVGGNAMNPSIGGRFFADTVLREIEGGTCADIGTGSGYLAIQMAKRQAHIYATDVDDEILRIASQNAQLNLVADRIVFRKGDLFANPRMVFDHIVANLPNETLPDALIGKQEFSHLDGGPNGCDVVLKLLSEAAIYLRNRSSSLYITQTSITDERLLEKEISQRFRSRILAERWIAMKPAFAEYFEIFYKTRMAEGCFEIRRVGEELQTRVRILQLKLK